MPFMCYGDLGARYIWLSDVSKDWGLSKEELLEAVRCGDLTPRDDAMLKFRLDGVGVQIEVGSLRKWLFRKQEIESQEVRRMQVSIMVHLGQIQHELSQIKARLGGGVQKEDIF